MNLINHNIIGFRAHINSKIALTISVLFLLTNCTTQPQEKVEPTAQITSNEVTLTAAQ